jgi:hypothetical protein
MQRRRLSLHRFGYRCPLKEMDCFSLRQNSADSLSPPPEDRVYCAAKLGATALRRARVTFQWIDCLDPTARGKRQPQAQAVSRWHS